MRRSRLHGFNPVMAAGILSVAARTEGLARLSDTLLVLAVSAFIVLVAGDVLIAARQPAALRLGGDGTHMALVLFTWVAACGVIGEGLDSSMPAALYLLAALASLGWVASVVVFVRTLRLAGGWPAWNVSGSWLLAVVAPQSLSILFSLLAERLSNSSLLAVSLVLWTLGVVIYVGLITLIMRRILRGELGADRLTPDYWITTGALAISTVAALATIRAAANLGMVGAGRELPAAVAITTWMSGGAWIPYLLVMEVARAQRHTLSLRYDVLRWSTVFPLGMFSVATYEIAQTFASPALDPIAQVFFWAGLGVGLLTAGAGAGAVADAIRRIS